MSFWQDLQLWSHHPLANGNADGVVLFTFLHSGLQQLRLPHYGNTRVCLFLIFPIIYSCFIYLTVLKFFKYSRLIKDMIVPWQKNMTKLSRKQYRNWPNIAGLCPFFFGHSLGQKYAQAVVLPIASPKIVSLFNVRLLELFIAITNGIFLVESFKVIKVQGCDWVSEKYLCQKAIKLSR